eukprot:jgi/Astpho2/5487/Aster-x0254
MVLEVSDSPSERMLLLRNTRGGQLLTLHLLHGWADTPARAGDAVNVLADAQMHEGQWHATCDYQSGFLVLHPDLLLSGTRISGSMRCPRQSILEERFGGSSSDKAVEGTLLHELFQCCLRASSGN